MKNICSLVLFGLICLSPSQAQDNLNALTAPSSPAAAVLGIQPTAILSPKSYQALETALFSNFRNGGSVVIPNDFGLEFTPYWTKNHGLSIREYLYPKDIWKDQVVRNSSFSLASTQQFLLGDSSATSSLAYGYRTTLYFANKADRAKVDSTEKAIRDKKSAASRILAEANMLVLSGQATTKAAFIQAIRPKVKTKLTEVYGDAGTDSLTQVIMNLADTLPEISNNEDAFLDAFGNIVTAALGSLSLFDHFEQYIRERQGWVVDIAYAGFVNFPTGDFTFSLVPRQSFWITPTYRFKDKMDFLKIMAVMRYEWYNVTYYRKYFPGARFFQDNKDIGLAVSGMFGKFSLDFEAVYRSSRSETPAGINADGKQLYTKDEDTDMQYTGTFSYRLSDKIVLTYTLGKRFEPVLNPSQTLVSSLSLNLGFGAPAKSDLAP